MAHDAPFSVVPASDDHPSDVGRFPVTGRRSRPFFASEPGGERERSGADVATLIFTLVPAALLALVAVPESGFEAALVGLLDAVPSWLDILWSLSAAAFGLWLLVLVLAAALRRRRDVLADMVFAALVGLGVAMVGGRRINGHWLSASEVIGTDAGGAVPLVLLVVGSAMSYAAAAHLTRPMRGVGRWAVVLAVGAAMLLGATTPSGALISVLVGAAAAAAVHLAVGTSTGRPTPADVAAALDGLGLVVEDLVVESRQPGGVVVFSAVGGDGDPLRIKVYGRDARDSQLLARMWRAAWYRGGVSVTVGRQEQVEHEAFVTLLATANGVSAPTVVVAGLTDGNDAVIVERGVGTELRPDELPSGLDVASELWRLVASIHEMGLVHGELGIDSFGVLDDSSLVLRDMASVTLSIDAAKRNADLAQLVTASAVLVGIEQSVLIAADRLGPSGVAAVLPYMQTVALSRQLRQSLAGSPVEMEAIRSALAAVVDVEIPDEVKLRRVSPKTFATAGLLVLVAFALIGAFANVDVSQLMSELAGASPLWAVAGLVVAQGAFFAQAVATRSAAPGAVPLGPLTMLQTSIAFVALAVPSTAGRLALDIRFFQRQGIPATSAVSISAIDGFSGFLVQITLLLLTLVVGLGDVELSFDRNQAAHSGDLVVVLAVAAGLLVLAIVLALALPRPRARLWERVRPLVAEARDTVRSLRSPTKLAGLFGGNLLNQVVYAVALGICLRAFGAELNLATLLVIYVAAALFGGLMPVPGGIGVMEAALMAGLVAAGVSTTTASATALLFRAFTYYLPPIWGWLALRWLQRRSYL